jgi:hypothetical protein
MGFERCAFVAGKMPALPGEEACVIATRSEPESGSDRVSDFQSLKNWNHENARMKEKNPVATAPRF